MTGSRRTVPLGLGAPDQRPWVQTPAAPRIGGVEMDTSGDEILSAQECLRLMGGVKTGRLALTVHALPTIVPVDFLIAEDGIVISTIRDSWIHGATRDAIVAFEADDVDPTACCRWSVVVVGIATELERATPQDRARLAVHLGWTDASHERLVVISLGLVSGTRTAVPVEAGSGLPAA